MKLKSLILLAGLVGGAWPAQAALTTYVGFNGNASAKETAFAGLLTTNSRKTDSLEGIDPDDTPVSIGGVRPLVGTVNLFGTALTAADGLATLGGAGSITGVTPTSGGRGPHDGNLYLEGLQNPFSISFNTAVKAFGFWGSDIGDFSSTGGDCDVGAPGCSGSTGRVLELAIEFDRDIALTVGLDILDDCSLSGSRVLLCHVSGGQTSGMAMFWGMTSTSEAAIKKVTFTNLTAQATTGALDGQGFDSFTLGDVGVTDPGGNNGTPEPAMVGLVGLALFAAGVSRRRRPS